MNTVSLTCYLNTVINSMNIIELVMAWTDNDKPADKDIQTFKLKLPNLPGTAMEITVPMTMATAVQAILEPARKAGFRSIRILMQGLMPPDDAFPMEFQSNDMKIHMEPYDLDHDTVGTQSHDLYMAAYREQCNSRKAKGRQILTLDPKYQRK